MTIIRVGPDRIEALATLHAAAFAEPWTAASLAQSLASPGAFAFGWIGERPEGFVLARAGGQEGEILTLAVDPAVRRQGIGRALVEAAVAAARQDGAEAIFLEAAADNAAALGLYEQAGFAEVGRRSGYYARPFGAAVDALVMRLDLPA